MEPILTIDADCVEVGAEPVIVPTAPVDSVRIRSVRSAILEFESEHDRLPCDAAELSAWLVSTGVPCPPDSDLTAELAAVPPLAQFPPEQHAARLLHRLQHDVDAGVSIPIQRHRELVAADVVSAYHDMVDELRWVPASWNVVAPHLSRAVLAWVDARRVELGVTISRGKAYERTVRSDGRRLRLYIIPPPAEAASVVAIEEVRQRHQGRGKVAAKPGQRRAA